ncbi:MAG TPA: WD40 repeat domain-containing protein [Fimbriimonadaceae bacterium]|jgi:WD40 repeat protein
MIETLTMLVCLSLSQTPQKPAAATVVVAPAKVIEGVRPEALAAGPKGSYFAASLENKSIEIIDATSHGVARTFQGPPQPAMAVAWSADGTLLASGDESARIFIWNAETGAKLQMLQGHQRGIQDLSFNYPRTLLISTGKDDVVKIWNVESGKSVASIPGDGANFYSATFEGKLNRFGVGVLGVGARDYSATGKVDGFYTGHGGQGVFDIAFNKAGTRAVTAGRDGTAIVWDTKTMTKLGSLKGHSDWVVHCAFSPNGQYIATSGDDRTVRIWSPYSFKQVGELDDQQAVGSPLCWTADGKYLITVNFSDFLQINSVTPPQGGVVAAAKPVRKHRRG